MGANVTAHVVEVDGRLQPVIGPPPPDADWSAYRVEDDETGLVYYVARAEVVARALARDGQRAVFLVHELERLRPRLVELDDRQRREIMAELVRVRFEFPSARIVAYGPAPDVLPAAGPA